MSVFTKTNWIDGQFPYETAAQKNRIEAGVANGSPVDTVAELESITGVSNGELRQLNGYWPAGDGGDGIYRRNASSSATRNGGTILTSADGGRWERLPSGVVSAHAFGARGDGSTNDADNIQAAIDAFAASTGRGTVTLNPEKTYVLTQRTGSEAGNLAALVIKKGVSLNGQGARLLLRGTRSIIGTPYPMVDETTITANVAYGATAITVSSTTSFAVGDEVFLRLGDNQWDSVETRYHIYAKVTAKTSTTLTLDRPILTALTVGTVTNAENKKVFRMVDPARGGRISNLDLVNDVANGGNAEAGIDLRWSTDMVVENISGADTGLHVMMNYAENMRVRNVGVRSAIAQNGQASKGRILNLTNCKDCSLDGVYGEKFEGAFAFIESYCKRVFIENVKITNNAATNLANAILFTVQGSHSFYRNLSVEGKGGKALLDAGGTTENFYSFDNLTMALDSNIVGGAAPLAMRGTFSHYKLSGTPDIFWMDYSQENEIFIPLVNSMASVTYTLPPGLLLGYSLYTPSTVTVGTDVNALFVGRTSNNGGDIKSQLIPGSEVEILSDFGSNTPASLLYNEPIKIIVSTGASGVTGTDKYISIKTRTVPREYFAGTAIPSSDAKKRVPGQGSTTTNTDTSGATLAALETEVNELKAALRAYGIISY